MTTGLRPAASLPLGDPLSAASELPPATGLSSVEAQALLLVHGPNEPAPAPRRTLWREITRPDV